MTDYGYYETDEPELVEARRGRGAQRLVNATGAVLSLSLVLGMCVWGYRLMVRDVTGVPVIEAMEGAFRTQPDDPGGMTAAHQGLQVNEIAAIGSTAGPVDEVRLAPPGPTLAEEDAPWGELAPPDAELAAPADPFVEEGEATDLLASFEDVSPLSGLNDAATLDEAPETPFGELAALDAPLDETLVETVEDRPEDADPVELAIAEALATEPVFADAMRPAPRPNLGSIVQVSAPADAQIAPVPAGPVDAADLPKGTRLVQLGAYASPDIARAEWDKIGGRFREFFGDKRMVVQEAISGGKTFYRLRAEGFEDLADARRFCSALTAAQADCIPVELR